MLFSEQICKSAHMDKGFGGCVLTCCEGNARNQRNGGRISISRNVDVIPGNRPSARKSA